MKTSQMMKMTVNDENNDFEKKKNPKKILSNKQEENVIVFPSRKPRML